MNRKSFVVVAAIVVYELFSNLPLMAIQDANQVAQRLNLRRESGSLPLWTTADAIGVNALTKIVQECQPGVFIVGTPRGGHGTAFVISRAHRLLATNAHVADIAHENGSMLAIRNNSLEIAEVENIWYHPGVKRIVGGELIVRSSNPSEGPVLPQCPDVAVLQLADGADLPFEFVLASPEEISDLFTKTVGMLGYPGHDVEWPASGERPIATFREGVVCRLTDFQNRADADPSELQFVQHTMASFGGFSGSPILIPNGHVVALLNSGGKRTGQGITVNLNFGVRVDCLWELLAHHKLDEKVSLGYDKSKLRLSRFTQPDPNDDRVRSALKLVAEAKVLMSDISKIEEVEKKCSGAIDLVPGFADAYNTRGVARNDFGLSAPNLSSETRIKWFQAAIGDYARYIEQAPNDPVAYVNHGSAICNLTNEQTGNQRNIDVVEQLSALLSSSSLDVDVRSQAYLTRAQATGWHENSIADIEKAIRLMPFEKNNWLGLSHYWRNQGDDYRSSEASNRYDELATADELIEQSFAADGQDRIRFRTQACEITGFENSAHLYLLAAAYVHIQDLNSALTWTKKAFETAKTQNEKTRSSRLLTAIQADMKNLDK